jgi:hypothetical protein
MCTFGKQVAKVRKRIDPACFPRRDTTLTCGLLDRKETKMVPSTKSCAISSDSASATTRIRRPAMSADALILMRARRLAKRTRALAACGPCKAKKMKCSDYRPCARCKGSDRELCIDYDASIHVATQIERSNARKQSGKIFEGSPQPIHDQQDLIHESLPGGLQRIDPLTNITFEPDHVLYGNDHSQAQAGETNMLAVN